MLTQPLTETVDPAKVWVQGTLPFIGDMGPGAPPFRGLVPKGRQAPPPPTRPVYQLQVYTNGSGPGMLPLVWCDILSPQGSPHAVALAMARPHLEDAVVSRLPDDTEVRLVRLVFREPDNGRRGKRVALVFKQEPVAVFTLGGLRQNAADPAGTGAARSESEGTGEP
jgi:hypothetical protein